MAGKLSCPHCRHELEAPPEFEGRSFRCPYCQKEFVGGATTDISAQAPKITASPAVTDVQAGLPALSGVAPWPAEDGADLDIRRGVGNDFRPGGNLALAVKVLLGLGVLGSVVMLGSEYLQLDIAQRLIARNAVPEPEIQSNDARQMAIGIVQMVSYLASAVVFLCWFYRVHANLKPLGASYLSFTSGWAVGSWFVPFLNLYRPMQIAQEIWRNSDPDAVMDGSIRGETSGNSTLIGFWWATWIISNIISNISVRAAWSINSPESLRASTILGMVAEFASIIAGLLALGMVVGIDSRQTARAEAMEGAVDSQGD